MIRKMSAMAMACLLLACSAGEEQARAESGSNQSTVKERVMEKPTQAPQAGDPNIPAGNHVRIATAHGDIVIELLPDAAPNTVANFKALAASGFYDGLTFHRVIPGFVAQGGDPAGNGTGGPGYTIKGEFSNLKHERGSVAMARTADPDSAGSQFYICYGPQPHLDGQYAIFGQVSEGMDAVDAIKQGDVMKSVSIEP
jgi:peptidylprolyl isomerase/peptidyl-prolyl cis-trans isomerase B (cyclophilin B)